MELEVKISHKKVDYNKAVQLLEKRVNEVIRLGVKKCIIPKNSKFSIDIPNSLNLHEVSNLQDAINICLK